MYPVVVNIPSTEMVTWHRHDPKETAEKKAERDRERNREGKIDIEGDESEEKLE